jgi:Ca-activated chloride channel family protein
VLGALGLAGQGFGDEQVSIVPRIRVNAPGTAAQTILRANSSLVLIPAHVTNASGSPVVGLKKEDFALFDDGVQQTITHFAQDDAPVSVGVLLDTSGSMKDKMARVSAAAGEFFRFANPEDEFFLIKFNGRAKLTIPFTRDWREIAWEIDRSKPFGLTALVDAIHLALGQMKHARNPRKALVVLSDGGDNSSRRTARELRDALMESDLQVYALGIFDEGDSRRLPAEEKNGPRLLNEVALETGGQEFPVRGLGELRLTGIEIARDLRNQYVLGYSPANPVADGKYHRITLKIAPPDAGNSMRAYYRRGYFAPAQ